MPVPKRKRSKARRDSRFANKGIKVESLANCQNCRSAVVPHSVCKTCGHYKGVKVMVTKIERGIKRDEARKARELKKKGASSGQQAE